ncbi:MAG: type II toxin-antitoxin system RelE/ParE family toxin [Melioribacteraceae bacterium]|nr:type II toxin-antitoxin system RelE/ParE family toxin [Melioribacteraceae bacterium]
MVKIVWTDRSVADLDDIAEYIAKDSIKYASLTIKKIFDQTLILENQPLIGRIVPELNDKKFRELIIGNYRVIYEYDRLSVNILTVHHSKRDLRKRNIVSNKD